METTEMRNSLTQDEKKLFDFYVGVAGIFEQSSCIAQAREANTEQMISPSVRNIKTVMRNEYSERVETINALFQTIKYSQSDNHNE